LRRKNPRFVAVVAFKDLKGQRFDKEKDTAVITTAICMEQMN